MKRTLGYVAAMSALGFVLLAGVGWLWQLRTGRPVTGEPWTVGTAGSLLPDTTGAQIEENPLMQLADGTAVAIELARRALLTGDNEDAAHALDAALRASDVGRYAEPLEYSEWFVGRQPFTRAYHAVREAREAVQNGRPLAALYELAEVPDELRALDGTARGPAAALSKYEGAVVINERGVRIGEVQSFVAGSDGQPFARLRLGGWQDFMGFIDLGGREVVLPAGALIFGRPRTFGTTAVALVTE